MTEFFGNRNLADAATEKLKVYAQPQRLMILSYLLRGENTVSNIDAATGIGQPALSQQLATLRRAELVKTRRDGKQIFYDLADEAARLCVRTMEALLVERPDPQRILEAAAHLDPPAMTAPYTSGSAGFAKIL